MKQEILWLTDPWETLDFSQETTLRWMEVARQLGHRNYWCEVSSLRLDCGVLSCDAREVVRIGADRTSADFTFAGPRSRAITDFTAVHFRPDPPVTVRYFNYLQLLGNIRSGPSFINPPDILCQVNEKFGLPAATVALPPSIVTCEWERLQAFGRQHGDTVAKPLNEAQSHGVFRLQWQQDASAMGNYRRLGVLTDRFRQPIILQKFLTEIDNGEMRIWYLDGQVLVSVRKRPMPGDFRFNIDQGSKLERAGLDASEKAVAEVIGQELRARGIRVAAVDMVGPWVIDFNVTSPGLMVQIEALYQESFSETIIRTLHGEG